MSDSTSNQKKKSLLIDLSDDNQSTKQKSSLTIIVIIGCLIVIGVMLFTGSNTQDIEQVAIDTPPPNEASSSKKQVNEISDITLEPTQPKSLSTPDATSQTVETHLKTALERYTNHATILNSGLNTKIEALRYQLNDAMQSDADSRKLESLQSAYKQLLIDESIALLDEHLQSTSNTYKALETNVYASFEWSNFASAYRDASTFDKPATFGQLDAYEQTYIAAQKFQTAAIKNLRTFAKRAIESGQPIQANELYFKLLQINAADEEAIKHLHENTHPAGKRAHSAPGGIHMRFVPAGVYTIGSAPNEFQRDSDEILREIQLTRAFYVAETETTQGQWLKVMKRLPSQFPDDPHLRSDQLPIHNVTWNEAKVFCEKLSEQSNKYTYRLPTEAEWEVACRAGTDEPFNNESELLDLSQANVFNLSTDKNIDAPTNAASYAPNPWGLYDMHGNVWEWTSDWMGAVTELSSIDPSNASLAESSDENLSTIVLRGGSYYDESDRARSANRWSYSPSIATTYIGFRIVATFQL